MSFLSKGLILSHVALDADRAIAELKEFIHNAAFPCVGAKSALSHSQIDFCVAASLASPETDRQITERLQSFARSNDSQSVFVSFITIFKDTPPLSEKQFEHFLWERLQSFHDIDRMSYQWDTEISCDPESPNFSMSIGGRGFYIVGLHPQSARKARQFKYPTLVFNLHSQFELLRSDGRYDHIHDNIMARDIAYSGSPNPMLAPFGEISEARQYSGREIEKTWKCPFHAHQKGASIAK